MNNLDLYKIKAKPQICLLLFAVGSLLCLLPDLCGVPSVGSETILQHSFTAGLPAWIVLPLVYAVAGTVIGILSADSIRAVIYGASVGQCQFLIPLIAHYFLHVPGSSFDTWWRALCGIVIASCLAGAACITKQAVTRKNRQ